MESNLELQIGAGFQYRDCPAICGPKALDHVARAWIACSPFIERLGLLRDLAWMASRSRPTAARGSTRVAELCAGSNPGPDTPALWIGTTNRGQEVPRLAMAVPASRADPKTDGVVGGPDPSPLDYRAPTL